MPQLPISQPFVARERTYGVRADPNLLTAEAEGVQQLGKGIAQASQSLGQIAQHLEEADFVARSADADRRIKTAALSYLDQLRTDQEPDKWEKGWESMLEKVKRDIDYGKLSPRSKQRIAEQVQSFGADTSMEVRQRARLKNVAIGESKVKAAAELDLQSNNLIGYENTLREGVRVGFIKAEDLEGLLQDGRRKNDDYLAASAIEQDPIAALDALRATSEDGKHVNFPHLDQSRRLMRINSAREAGRALRTETFNNLVERALQKDFATPAELTDLVNRRVLTATQAKHYENSYLRGSREVTASKIGELFGQINAYDPLADGQDDKHEELMAQIATSGLPERVQSEAWNLLKEKRDPNHAFNSPVAKETFQAIEQRFRLGIYGKYETRRLITSGPLAGQYETQTDAKAYEQAVATKSRIEDATRKFLRTKPNATAEEVNKFVSGLQASHVTKAGRSEVLRALGAPDPTATRSGEDAKGKAQRLDEILAKAKGGSK